MGSLGEQQREAAAIKVLYSYYSLLSLDADSPSTQTQSSQALEALGEKETRGGESKGLSRELSL